MIGERKGEKMDNTVENYRRRREKRLRARMDADDDGKWVTTENGHKIHINEEGEPDKGNPHVLKIMKNAIKGASSGKIVDSPAKPKYPNLRKCEKAISRSLKDGGALHMDYDGDGTNEWEFQRGTTKKDVLAHVTNTLRRAGYNAEARKDEVFIKGSKKGADFCCEVFRGNNTADDKTYWAIHTFEIL